MVLQVRRPEAVQGHQDEGGPGETGQGAARGRQRVVWVVFLFFFSYFIVCSEYYKQMEEGGRTRKVIRNFFQSLSNARFIYKVTSGRSQSLFS